MFAKKLRNAFVAGVILMPMGSIELVGADKCPQECPQGCVAGQPVKKQKTVKQKGIDLVARAAALAVVVGVVYRYPQFSAGAALILAPVAAIMIDLVTARSFGNKPWIFQ